MTTREAARILALGLMCHNRGVLTLSTYWVANYTQDVTPRDWISRLVKSILTRPLTLTNHIYRGRESEIAEDWTSWVSSLGINGDAALNFPEGIFRSQQLWGLTPDLAFIMDPANGAFRLKTRAGPLGQLICHDFAYCDELRLHARPLFLAISCLYIFVEYVCKTTISEDDKIELIKHTLTPFDTLKQSDVQCLGNMNADYRIKRRASMLWDSIMDAKKRLFSATTSFSLLDTLKTLRKQEEALAHAHCMKYVRITARTRKESDHVQK